MSAHDKTFTVPHYQRPIVGLDIDEKGFDFDGKLSFCRTWTCNGLAGKPANGQVQKMKADMHLVVQRAWVAAMRPRLSWPILKNIPISNPHQ